MLPSFNLSDLPGAWWPVVNTPQGRDMEQELNRELPDGHSLKGRRVAAVAVHGHLKDTLFWLPETSEWAVMHLTGRVETDPAWPSTFVASDWKTLANELT